MFIATHFPFELIDSATTVFEQASSWTFMSQIALPLMYPVEMIKGTSWNGNRVPEQIEGDTVYVMSLLWTSFSEVDCKTVIFGILGA